MDESDRRAMEKELQNGLRSIQTDMSHLKFAILLAKLRPVYETLHPETTHGGDRRSQPAKLAAWPSFPKLIAQTGKCSERTAQRFFLQGKKIQSLGPELIIECLDSLLANKLGVLERPVEVPEGERLDLVNSLKVQYFTGLRKLREYTRSDAEEPAEPVASDEESDAPEPKEPPSVAAQPRLAKTSDREHQVELPLRRAKEGFTAMCSILGLHLEFLVTRDQNLLVVRATRST